MKIKYATRSQFINPCELIIKEQEKELLNGKLIEILLKNGGYNAEIIVTIDLKNKIMFDTNWENSDPTRFPARIKAAATALLNLKHDGQFIITHNNGYLKILLLNFRPKVIEEEPKVSYFKNILEKILAIFTTK